MRILAVLVASFTAASAAAEPPADAGVGTLFYSTQERAAIVQARNVEKTAAGGIALMGVVRRANGKGTLWTNGRPFPEGTAIPTAGIPSVRSDGVLIDGAKVRVGETLDPQSGERTDLLPPGAIRRGKAQ